MASLAKIESVLNAWLQPLALGEKWDNVGLLVGSGRHSRSTKMVNRILLTNDLTPSVMAEAIAKKSDLILSYHPPIFSGLKAIAYGSWKEEIIAQALYNDILIYSPHTTLDSAIGGVNDNLVESLGEMENINKVESVNPHFPQVQDLLGILVNANPQVIRKTFETIYPQFQNNVKFSFHVLSEELAKKRNLASYSMMGVYFNPQETDEMRNKIKEEIDKVDGTKETIGHKYTIGAGRIVHFKSPMKLDELVQNVKRNLNLSYVQVAYGGKQEINSVAICAGSGSSLLKGVKADLYLTGEMSHHDILDCVENQISLILCGHCNSERPYLQKLGPILKMITGVEEVSVSESDRSPLKVQ